MTALRWLIPVICGFATGWLVARFALESNDQAAAPATPHPPVAPAPGRAPDPPPTRHPADEAEAFAALPAAGPSPYRHELARRFALSHRSTTALRSGLLDGTITGEAEVAAAFRKIAETDPLSALDTYWQIASRLGRSGSRTAHAAIWQAWATTDTENALAHLASLPNSTSTREAESYFARAWVGEDPRAAVTHLAANPSFGGPVYGKDMLADAVAAWAKADPAAAGAWVDHEAPTGQRDTLQDRLTLAVLESRSAGEAIDYLLSRPENPENLRLLRDQWQNWALGSRDAAFEKLAELPPGHPLWTEADDISQRAVAFDADPASALEWAAKMPDGIPRHTFLEGLVNYGASNDTGFALAILPALPESTQRENAVRMLTELWMRQDPAGVSEWLATLEPSASRDGGVARFATLLADDDPARAADWAASIDNPNQRDRTLEPIVNSWLESDPTAANAWLEAQPNP